MKFQLLPLFDGMLAGLKFGVSEGGGERLSRAYAYNSFGGSTAVAERTTSNSFTYDGLGRLTSACGRTYSDDSVRQLQAGLSDDFELLQPRETASKCRLSHAGRRALRAPMAADRPLPNRAGRIRLDAPCFSRLVV